MTELKRAYMSVDDIEREFLPMSKKKIREFVVNNLRYTKIGGRIYVPRQELETWFNENSR